VEVAGEINSFRENAGTYYSENLSSYLESETLNELEEVKKYKINHHKIGGRFFYISPGGCWGKLRDQLATPFKVQP